MAAGFCSELAQMCTTSRMEVVTLKRELDLLIVVLPDINGSLHGDLKRISEAELGIVYQLSRRIPVVGNRPIIFGADVTHSHPGEDSSPPLEAERYRLLHLKIGLR
ncbi:hypothetical protein POM88_047553 [Heracleum sosnowskyi]|uniref:Piwi domain-containing protein n=1 Tax=Heracleum sosnowskyi TaxID=360622 RepID=A0AAD8GU10_9APIA|nr:hypothetical protein POM88_047553 [Heracleum sosnowskyi]